MFSMDDLKSTTNFFKTLRDINRTSSKLSPEHIRLIAITCEETLLKRRQLSQEVVGSLLREISFVVLRAEVPKMYFLELIRQVGSKYNRVGRMFEEDNEGYGINGFN